MGFFIKLALGGLNIAKLVGGWISAFFKSLNAQGWMGLIAAAALGVLSLHEGIEARHWKKQSDQYETLYGQAQSALAATVANYRTAAEKARQDDAANKARVEADQAKINQESSNDYEARIADARAAADRLRQQLATATHSGGSGSAPMPGVPAPAGGSDHAAAQDGFSVDDRLTATEQAIQLDELIKWVKKQAAVDVNGKPAS